MNGAASILSTGTRARTKASTRLRSVSDPLRYFATRPRYQSRPLANGTEGRLPLWVTNDLPDHEFMVTSRDRRERLGGEVAKHTRRGATGRLPQVLHRARRWRTRNIYGGASPKAE